MYYHVVVCLVRCQGNSVCTHAHCTAASHARSAWSMRREAAGVVVEPAAERRLSRHRPAGRSPRSGRRLSSHRMHCAAAAAIGRSLADTHACVLCWLVNARHVVRMRSWKLAAIAKAKLLLWYWGLGLAAAGAYAHGSCAHERERLVLRARGLCLVLRCVTTTLVLGLLAKVRSLTRVHAFYYCQWKKNTYRVHARVRVLYIYIQC
jgi:hypothetical protein